MTDRGIRRMVLATDLGAESPDLFAHALGLALRARAELFLLHIDDDLKPDADWRRLPTVRTLLERWGALPAGALPGDLEVLGIRVQPLEHRPTGRDLPAAVIRRVAELDPDLLLLGTQQRSGFERLFVPSVSEPVARDIRRSTLLVPDRAQKLVDPRTGALRIERILIPISAEAPQQPLIDELVRLLEALEVGPIGFTLVHVGADRPPTPELPSRTDWRWNTDLRRGAVVDQILEAEIAHEADLIAMATEGRHGLLDGIRGSTAERVVRRARCPVLTVPVRADRAGARGSGR